MSNVLPVFLKDSKEPITVFVRIPWREGGGVSGRGVDWALEDSDPGLGRVIDGMPEVRNKDFVEGVVNLDTSEEVGEVEIGGYLGEQLWDVE
jgi:hypothetical protein